MGVDWDQALAYKTQKTVVIRDRRLGGMYYMFGLFVAVYIFVYVMMWQQKYNIFESPDGNARLELQAPKPELCRNQTDLTYCATAGNDGSTNNGLLQNDGKYAYPCQYRDQYFVVYPQVERNSMLVTTRYTSKNQSIPKGCDPVKRDSRTCTEWNKDGSTTAFVAEVEKFTLLIDHSWSAPLAAKSGTASGADIVAPQSGGWIQNTDGDLFDPKDDAAFYKPYEMPGYIHVGAPRDKPSCKMTGCKDIIPLRTLLRAAGIKDLDHHGTYKNQGKNESYRYSGFILSVRIFYENTVEATGHYFAPNKFSYFYKVQLVEGAEYKGSEAIVHGEDRLVNDRHGIRINFSVSGKIGHFDTMQMFMQLAVASSMVGMITLGVDMIATKFMPEKKFYFDVRLGSLSLSPPPRGAFLRAPQPQGC